MDNNGGNVYKYKKDKGYESLPREMLQDNNMTWGARGLLGNIESLPDNYRIHKVKLYDMCPDKKKVTERYWNELVVNGYIIQFRKMSNRKSEYIYLFSSGKFTSEEVEEKIKEFSEIGFSLYLNKSQEEAFNKQSESKSVEPAEKSKVVKNEVPYVRNEQVVEKPYVPNEHMEEIPSNKDSHHMFETNCSEGANIRFTNKGLDDDDYLIYINNISQNDKLKSISKYLIECGVELNDVIEIANEMTVDPRMANINLIRAQMEWCVDKSHSDGIGNFHKYFIRGLKMRLENQKIKYNVNAENGLFESDKQEQGDTPKGDIPLFNWLDDC